MESDPRTVTADLSDIAFDAGETITEALHYLAGCEDALLLVLADLISPDHDRARAAYAVVAAITHFRQTAQREAEALTRASMDKAA